MAASISLSVPIVIIIGQARSVVIIDEMRPAVMRAVPFHQLQPDITFIVSRGSPTAYRHATTANGPLIKIPRVLCAFIAAINRRARRGKRQTHVGASRKDEW